VCVKLFPRHYLVVLYKSKAGYLHEEYVNNASAKNLEST